MPPRPNQLTSADVSPPGQRVQKVLAAAGFGSRRQCEEFIITGRVEVDGRVITELGTRVDPARQEIRVDGELLRPARFVYFALHKPPGVVSTARDPAGRPRVIDLVPGQPRVFPVGRLDLHSEGLILLTNDGDLANGLTHPRHEVEKLYRVLVAGELTEDDLLKLRRGVHLAEGFARPQHVRIRGTHKQATWLEIVLAEGRNREIRRLLAQAGHKVQRIIRIGIGSLRLAELPRGAYRPLERGEVESLRRDIADSRRRRRTRERQQAAASPPRRQFVMGTVIGGESGASRLGRRPSRRKDKETVSAPRLSSRSRRKGRPR